MSRSKIGARARYEVLRRCEFACFYCGEQPPTKLVIDHVVPVAKGGTDDPWNLVAACQPCNVGKLDSVPSEETVRRAICSWRTYIQMAGRDSWFCYVCGRPVQIEPEALEDRDIAQCSSCSAAVCDAYESGLRAAKRVPSAVV